ncbi:hypothetical protein GPL15_14665 [Clostridium sp. MCC353]|uniref:AAA family ATPase n=1 Tax=Clostridium sp. MCC353 TaxID=2592646 RepID=UPI001C0321D5|nr:hypothetical protein [Clostridium sp. MCC353]MBT9777744.1 hypothetical protein [Clostridium sp. MCC353]
MKKIIIIQGYLASGKSTFALKLSKSINVPYLIKDTFKIALCENITVADRKESSRFSTVTFDAMMYVTERMLEAGYPIILEGNFMPGGIKKVDESMCIKRLIDKYGYSSLTFQFTGDPQVLYKRFIDREKTPERGQVNTMGYVPSYDEFNKWCHNLDNFNVGGELVKVDTTDFSAVDFNNHLELARRFISVQ